MRYMYVCRKLFAKFLMNSYQPISGLLIRCFFGFVVNGNAFNFDLLLESCERENRINDVDMKSIASFHLAFNQT